MGNLIFFSEQGVVLVSMAGQDVPPVPDSLKFDLFLLRVLSSFFAISKGTGEQWFLLSWEMLP